MEGNPKSDDKRQTEKHTLLFIVLFSACPLHAMTSKCTGVWFGTTSYLYRRDENIQVTGSGHVQSPRFPRSYPRNLLLTWRLQSQEKTRIQLAFDHQFGLEEAENDICRYDFVEIEDISETSTVVRGRWCGHKEIPPRITSRTNQIKITFKSDDYFVTKPGFKIYYSFV
ncbi:hypothetical protein STEG23_007226, partial [Scotinomys teguina]